MMMHQFNHDVHQLISADVSAANSADEMSEDEDMDVSDMEVEDDDDDDQVQASGSAALADHLLRSRFYESGSQLDQAFRTIDRKLFLPPELQQQAYVDTPMRYGLYHHSQPNIYASALYELNIQANDSFINIGSGTGYLNNLVATLLIAPDAVNHGIELHQQQVDFATQCTADLIADGTHSPKSAIPKFFTGNAFAIDKRNRKYDKMYIGQECRTMETCETLMHLLNTPGIVVVPIDSFIFRIVKDEDGDISATAISAVGFGELVPAEEDEKIIMLEQQVPRTLMAMCRDTIRKEIGQTKLSSVLPRLSIPNSIARYLNYNKAMATSSNDTRVRYAIDIASESQYLYASTLPLLLVHTGSILIELFGAEGGCKYGRDFVEAIGRAKHQLRKNSGCISQLTVTTIDLSPSLDIDACVSVLAFEVIERERDRERGRWRTRACACVYQSTHLDNTQSLTNNQHRRFCVGARV